MLLWGGGGFHKDVLQWKSSVIAGITICREWLFRLPGAYHKSRKLQTDKHSQHKNSFLSVL